jgi:hypothetical protein
MVAGPGRSYLPLTHGHGAQAAPQTGYDTPMRKTALMASILTLAGCAYPNPQHVAALNALIGKTEADLVRSEGVPSRTYDAGGHKFLAYSRSRIESIGGEPGFGPYGYGGWGGWGGYGGWGGFPPEIIQRDCETTFEVGGGLVLHWGFRGNAC